jgi:hypothetical protein
LDDVARLKGQVRYIAHPVWPVATHQGELTARRLVITFVPTTVISCPPTRDIEVIDGELRLLARTWSVARQVD